MWEKEGVWLVMEMDKPLHEREKIVKNFIKAKMAG